MPRETIRKYVGRFNSGKRGAKDTAYVEYRLTPRKDAGLKSRKGTAWTVVALAETWTVDLPDTFRYRPKTSPEYPKFDLKPGRENLSIKQLSTLAVMGDADVTLIEHKAYATAADAVGASV